jgi:DNA mismatch repair protein MutL
LVKTNFRKRIVDVFGKTINQSLVPVKEETSLVKITGFIGQPKFARKTTGEQFFFVNKRYMRHPYFHRAVMQAYEKVLPPETFPSYFLFLDLDPSGIDINVHPTKTEIKFENERTIWQIIHAAIRESLGKYNVVPSIDFDQSGSIDIPVPEKEGGDRSYPEIKVDPGYNPFDQEKETLPGNWGQNSSDSQNREHWEDLYSGTGTNYREEQSQLSFKGDEPENRQAEEKFTGKKVLQLKQKYILTPVKSGVMIIDQKRAHERILFEKFMEVLKSESVASQQQLFPQKIELDAGDAELLKNILDDLLSLGFDIREFGKNTFVINGTPGVLDVSSPEIIVEKLLEEYKNSPVDARAKAKEQVAISLAKASALDYGTDLGKVEIDHLIDNLFACATPNYTPEGKKVLTIQPLEDIEKMFAK